MGTYRRTHQPAHATSDNGDRYDMRRSPAASLRERLELLESDGHLNQKTVPTDGTATHVLWGPVPALTDNIYNSTHRVGVQLFGIVYGPSGDPFCIGEATVHSPAGLSVRYFVTRPARADGQHASLVGVVSSGFPLTVSEQAESRHSKVADPWQLELSQDHGRGLYMREVSVAEHDPETVVYTAASTDVMQEGVFDKWPEFWAPDPAELARAATHQAADVGETALVATVNFAGSPDNTAMLHPVR